MNPKTVPAGSGAVFTFMPAPDNVLTPSHAVYLKNTKSTRRLPQKRGKSAFCNKLTHNTLQNTSKEPELHAYEIQIG